MVQVRNRRPLGPMLATLAVVVGVGTAAAACAPAPGPKSVALRAPGVAPGAAIGAAGGSTAVDTTAPGASAATTGPVAPGTTAAVPSGPGQPGTTRATTPRGGTPTTAPVTTTAPKTTVPVGSGPAPVQPGLYVYNLQPGGWTNFTYGTKSIPLTPAAQNNLNVTSTGVATQLWTTPVTDTTLSFTNGGVFVVSQTVKVPGMAPTTCNFNPAVASPPWPLAVGKTSAGSCQGLTVGVQVAGTDTTVPLHGAMVSTYTVTTTYTMGTSLVVSETDWYTSSLRLPVQTTVAVKGTTPGYTIGSVVTYRLA